MREGQDGFNVTGAVLKAVSSEWRMSVDGAVESCRPSLLLSSSKLCDGDGTERRSVRGVEPGAEK